MALSKPALMSAFLCPGMGQWAAGKRGLGAAMIAAALLGAVPPFFVFIAGLFFRAGGCDVLNETLWACDLRMIANAWHRATPFFLFGIPFFFAVWIVSVLHASRLTLPGGAPNHSR